MKSTAFGQNYLPQASFPIAGKYKPRDIAWLDLSVKSKSLAKAEISDHSTFSDYINKEIAYEKAVIGMGGYGERRNVYQRFSHFNSADTFREIHLGIDIWAPKKTPVLAVLPGVVHSVARHDTPGDYGPTIIIKHMVANSVFYTLYGHLNKAAMTNVKPGQIVSCGQEIAKLGGHKVNKGWPPHLHFQIILKLDKAANDYPGVCTLSESAELLKNCPDPLAWFQHSWKCLAEK